MAFSHHFDPTVLREYDIRGIVGRTLHPTDAFAIGRVFGSMIARAGGSKVAVGYDGRLTSPELEQALVEGLCASGMQALRIGLGPTPMLYYTAMTLETDGAIMVTGSHNPPDYNGFKMMLGRKPFFGQQILQIGSLAESGDVVPEANGTDQAVAIAEDYVARLLADWDGGDRMLKVVWDNGNGAAGDVLQTLVASLPGEHVVLNGAIDGR
ncbi:MAG: phosphomannomutase, partial [Pseudomonadota bacterium]|nr:phosphomannomutase [Pseudomonadota bacterium]